MKRVKYLILFLLITALLLSGCGFIKVREEGSALPEPSIPAASEPAAQPCNPLTGLPESSDISAERPFAVMVNNIIYAQPQVGVGQADWIYEI